MPLDSSSIIRCFGSFIHPGDPAGPDETPACVQMESYLWLHGPPLLSHSHLEALLLLSPSRPKWLKARIRERAAKPLDPTSTGRHLALHPASLTSPVYLESFFQGPIPGDCQLQKHSFLAWWTRTLGSQDRTKLCSEFRNELGYKKQPPYWYL